MYVCMYVCIFLSVCLSIHLSAYLCVYRFTHIIYTGICIHDYRISHDDGQECCAWRHHVLVGFGNVGLTGPLILPSCDVRISGELVSAAQGCIDVVLSCLEGSARSFLQGYIPRVGSRGFKLDLL